MANWHKVLYHLISKTYTRFRVYGSEYITNLSKIESNILKLLALKGYKTSYDLSEKDKVGSNSTVWKALNKLKRLKLIEIKHEEPFSKIPSKNKKYYGLTFRGIIASLKTEGVNLQKVKNYTTLVHIWINEARKKIENLPSQQLAKGFLIFKEDFTGDASEFLESILVDYVESGDERVEAFFKHFDLEYSNDELIFQSLLMESLSYMIQNLSEEDTG